MTKRISGLSCLRLAQTVVLFLCCCIPTTWAQTNYLRLKSFGYYESSSASLYAPVIEASDGLLYGTSYRGGSNGDGTVFRIDRDGSNYMLLKSFVPTNGDGLAPEAAVLEASDGVLYSVTVGGGEFGVGTIFKLNKNGSGYAVLHSFSTNGTDGMYPDSSLCEASDGSLYGATPGGGTGQVGTVFRVHKDGSGYGVLKHFGSPGEGTSPNEVVELSDGRLYGTTETGGSNNPGTVFSLRKDGNDFITLLSFSGTNGLSPLAGVIEGPDGLLYGTTYQGGESNMGTVFRLNKDGTGHTVLRSFLGNDADDGAGPCESRLCQGNDGLLYGATLYGGTNGNGTLFRVNTNGNSYSKLRIFRLTTGEAGRPVGLIEGTDGYIYGTAGGGQRSYGTVFKLNKDGSGYKILINFPQSGGDGEAPQSSLVEGGLASKKRAPSLCRAWVSWFGFRSQPG